MPRLHVVARVIGQAYFSWRETGLRVASLAAAPTSAGCELAQASWSNMTQGDKWQHAHYRPLAAPHTHVMACALGIGFVVAMALIFSIVCHGACPLLSAVASFDELFPVESAAWAVGSLDPGLLSAPSFLLNTLER